jgi:hypothetical protein
MCALFHVNKWVHTCLLCHCTFVTTAISHSNWGHCGRDRMVVGFTTLYAISNYHHWSCEFESCSLRGVLNTTLCDKVCQRLATGLWFSRGTLVSSTNKTEWHDIAEIGIKHHKPNHIQISRIPFIYDSAILVKIIHYLQSK